jgi:Rod binding domain-containing protein
MNTNGAELILTAPVTTPETLSAKDNTPEKLKQIAKDFESVLMSQLVGTMKDTIGSLSEDDEEAGAGQVRDMFWMCLSREVGDKGGMGLWKDLYQFFSDNQKPQNTTQSLDKNL